MRASGVTAVTKEPKRTGTEQVGALREVAGGAACRRRLGGGGRGAVRVAPEPKPVTVLLGRQWVCAGGPAGPETGALSSPCACGLQLHLFSPPAGLAAYLAPPAGLPPYLPAQPLARGVFPRARGSWQAAPRGPGALVLSLSAAPGHSLGKGLRPRIWEGTTAVEFSGGCYPGKKPHPNLHSRCALGRAGVAAGEGKGLAARGSQPQPAPRTPPPLRGGRRHWDREETRGGLARRAGWGRSRPGAGQGAGTSAARYFSTAGAGGGAAASPPAERPTRGG